MGLKQLIEVTPENTDPVVGQVTVRGMSLRFRRPDPALFTTEEKAAKELEKLAPSYIGSQSTLIYLLGRCYVPDPEEGEVKPFEMLAELAEKNELFFTDLVAAFFQAFPALSDWLAAQADAKNASGGGTDSTGDASSPSPSPSVATPTSSHE